MFLPKLTYIKNERNNGPIRSTVILEPCRYRESSSIMHSVCIGSSTKSKQLTHRKLDGCSHTMQVLKISSSSPQFPQSHFVFMTYVQKIRIKPKEDRFCYALVNFVWQWIPLVCHIFNSLCYLALKNNKNGFSFGGFPIFPTKQFPCQKFQDLVFVLKLVSSKIKLSIFKIINTIYIDYIENREQNIVNKKNIFNKKLL